MYINGVQITGVQPKPIELTQAEYDALPEIEKQNGCYIITDAESEPFTAENVSYDNTDSGLVATDVQAAIDELAEGGGGGGGHTIVNDSGTSMTQRSDLQFNGVYTSDNSTDDTTEVNIIREMTEAQYSQLTDAEKKGIIVTDASTPSVIGLTGDMVMYDSTNTVNQVIDDLNGTACAKNGIFDGALTKIATFTSVSDVESFLTAHNVSTGTFTGLKVGQTITITDGTYNVDWIIAGFDTNYQKGYKSSSDHPNGVTNHHIALIPKTTVTSASMNDSNVTTGGYMGSKMYTTTLPAVVTALQTVLSTHLLEQCSLLSNAVTDGKSSGWTWAADTAIYATLMSEANVYGAPIIGNFYDQGIDNMKLPIFNFIPTTYTGRFNFWLRSVASASYFVYVTFHGNCYAANASYSSGVRPLILLG